MIHGPLCFANIYEELSKIMFVTAHFCSKSVPAEQRHARRFSWLKSQSTCIYWANAKNLKSFEQVIMIFEPPTFGGMPPAGNPSPKSSVPMNWDLRIPIDKKANFEKSKILFSLRIHHYFRILSFRTSHAMIVQLGREKTFKSNSYGCFFGKLLTWVHSWLTWIVLDTRSIAFQ